MDADQNRRGAEPRVAGDEDLAACLDRNAIGTVLRLNFQFGPLGKVFEIHTALNF